MKANIDCDLPVTRRNLKWILNPSDFVQCEFFWTGSKDTWDSYHVLKLLKPGAVFFDVGANFGYYSILVRSELGAQCRVFSFEPNPPTYARLRKNIELNGFEKQITAVPLALSDAVGPAWMVDHPGNTGDARVNAAGGDRQISLTTLDAFCASEKISRIDFIKIDVQGYEEHLLLGGKETLTRLKPPLLIELEPSVLQAQGSSAERIVELLHEHRYRLHIAERERLVPLELPLKSSLRNAFCLP